MPAADDAPAPQKDPGAAVQGSDSAVPPAHQNPWAQELPAAVVELVPQALPAVAAQVAGAAADAAQNVPRGHAMGCAAAPVQYEPAGHAVSVGTDVEAQ